MMETKTGKIGIYGGTFDPIHYGHLITVQSVLEQRKLDKVIFIPCYISPHKSLIVSSRPEHRLEMLRLAIDEFDYFTYSDYEVENGSISYTINTIRELKKEYDEIELIIGYDNLLFFETWHKPDEILQLCKLIVMQRRIDIIPEKRNKYFDQAIFVGTPLIEISSTTIRDRVKRGLPIRYMVPEAVEKYIYKKKLFI